MLYARVYRIRKQHILIFRLSQQGFLIWTIFTYVFGFFVNFYTRYLLQNKVNFYFQNL